MRHQSPRAALAVLPVKHGKTAGVRPFQDAARNPAQRAARDFISLFLWVSGFLAAGYLLLWKPLLDRWVF